MKYNPRTLFGFFVVLGLILSVGCQPDKPELPEPAVLIESAMERKASIVEAFDGKASPLEGPHAKSINDLFTRLGQAFKSASASNLKPLFDFPMTLALVKHQGLLPSDLEKGLNKKMMTMLTDTYIDATAEQSRYLAWEEHQVRSIRFFDTDKRPSPTFGIATPMGSGPRCDGGSRGAMDPGGFMISKI